MTDKDSPLNAQRVEGTVEKSGSVPKGCRAPRERVSVTVTGSVKGDGEETQLRQVAEHAGVYPPAQRNAMEKNQRYPPPARLIPTLWPSSSRIMRCAIKTRLPAGTAGSRMKFMSSWRRAKARP
jgi:hypothetical protein